MVYFVTPFTLHCLHRFRRSQDWRRQNRLRRFPIRRQVNTVDQSGWCLLGSSRLRVYDSYHSARCDSLQGRQSSGQSRSLVRCLLRVCSMLPTSKVWCCIVSPVTISDNRNHYNRALDSLFIVLDIRDLLSTEFRMSDPPHAAGYKLFSSVTITGYYTSTMCQSGHRIAHLHR